MPMSFPSTVNPPGGASYSAPLMSFQNFSNWAQDDPYDASRKAQEKQLNEQAIAQRQQQLDLAKTFQGGGLPRDAQGGIDYAKAAQMLAQKGDIQGAMTMLQQQPAPMSPMFGGGAAQPGGQPQGQPTSVPARPLPPPSPNAPQGDSGRGTIASMVTDRLPNEDATTGQTIGKIAQLLGVDPNAQLTPGQTRRAQGLLDKYAPADSAAGQGGRLPPSANAVAPAPAPAVPSAAPAGRPQPVAAPPAPIGAGSPQIVQPLPAAPVPQPQAVTAQPQGGPITPHEPLPNGFSDPQAAIFALRREADKYDRMPNGKGEAKRLDAWADRIQTSIAPVKLGQYDTYVDPKDPTKVLAQGPNAALLSGAAGRSETVESDAEVYRQTGKMPAGIARTPQGQAEAHAIRQLAREKEIADGGDPAEWSSRWQSFAAQASGKRALETRAAGLTLAENEASSLIPRVREISGKISRTNYPTLNSLILASQKGRGGQDVIKLGIAVESLVPVYARVLKPVGQVGQGDMARAHDILDKAWSDGQINAALDQMQVELKSARTALDKTMSDSESRGRGKKDDGAKTSAPADGGKSSGSANVTPGGYSFKVLE